MLLQKRGWTIAPAMARAIMMRYTRLCPEGMQSMRAELSSQRTLKRLPKACRSATGI
jgi:hypothetical protein